LRRHQEMAEGHDDRADDHRALPPEPTVGHDAAEDGREVERRDVHAVHHRGVLLREQQLLRHVIDEQRAHAVVGEDLPHLREKQNRQPGRLAQPAIHATVSGAPHTIGGQSTRPSAYTTPGTRSRWRKIGPSRSTMSQCWPSTNAGAIARLVPTMLPTITRKPISR